MEAEQLIRKYLQTVHTMQLATVRDGQPWCASVYFAPDDDLNLYWISTPGRRHSHEVEAHRQVGAAIAVRLKVGEKVVGIQVEGDAVRVTDSAELEHAARAYDARFHHDPAFIQDFIDGKREHKFYRLKPRLFVLFDERTFATDARKEWRP